MLVILLLAACQQYPTSIETMSDPAPSPTALAPSPTALIQAMPTASDTPEIVLDIPSTTTTPLPTRQPTLTPLPDGFGVVPDLVGLSLADARTAVKEAGFTFLFQDVLNPDVPSSTIVDQDPPSGFAMPLQEVIYLYRSFQALEMYAGGECQPLRISLPAGKLLYWVELDEGITYTIRTDFPYGKTQVSDYRMYLIAEFENASSDSVDVKPLAPGRYVISLGPYEVSKNTLDQAGSLLAGCLWVTPEDLGS